MEINDIVYNPGETEYVTSFNDATTAAYPFSSRILLLSDQDSSSNFIRDHMTVDFNGHTMTWTGSYGNTTVSLSGTGVTFLNTGTSQGHFIGTINLWGSSGSSPNLIIPADTNLLIDALEVKEGTASLAGGTFGTITILNGSASLTFSRRDTATNRMVRSSFHPTATQNSPTVSVVPATTLRQP